MVEQSRVELTVKELFQLAPHCKEAVLMRMRYQPSILKAEKEVLPGAPALAMEKASLREIEELWYK